MRMCLGQLKELDEEAILFSKQLGITGVQFNTPLLPGEKKWEYKDILALKKRCQENGLICETIENVPIKFYDKVMLGLPGRDEQIENYQDIIRSLGKAEIPILGYHFTPTFVWRTNLNAIGRGGAKVSSFDMADKNTLNKITYSARTDVKVPDVETMWKNYEYFIKAVLPTAKEAGVKLALHPDDPPVESVAGVARLFTTIDDLIRAEKIVDSKWWGLDLCLGTCSEMVGGKDNVFKAIDYFGPKGKILYIHFRDVQGSIPKFQECFLGEGNYNPAQVIQELKRVGFDGYLMTDHVPKIVGDNEYGYRARGYGIGYIQGLIKMSDYIE